MNHTISGTMLAAIMGLSAGALIAAGPKVHRGQSDPKGVILPFNYEGV